LDLVLNQYRCEEITLTRSGPSKPSDARHGANRLISARGFLESVNVQISSAHAGALGNPIAATVVNAAIAFPLQSMAVHQLFSRPILLLTGSRYGYGGLQMRRK